MTELPEDELAALPIGYMRAMDGITVLELGNKKNVTGLYRNWYTDRGLNYLCLDWNGEDDAVALDMREPLMPYDVIRADVNKRHYVADERLFAGFDVVTNFGFTEHVEDQAMCWRNVHHFVRFGGYLSICMPLMPWWKGHGLWMPTVEWYDEFAKLNGYTIEFEQVWERVRKTYVARMRKTGICEVFEMPVGKMERSSK